MSFQIETERLLLRDVREDDVAILIAQACEPEARRGILSYQANEFYNRQALKSAINWAKMRRRENYTLAVELKSDGTLIGSCNVAGVQPESRETNVGWHYGSKFWGRGYATEAARELLYIGFEIGKAREIYADCFADNLASARIMEKIGMRSTRNLGLFNTIRGWSYGETRPAVRYTISRNQWLKQNTSQKRRNAE